MPQYTIYPKTLADPDKENSRENSTFTGGNTRKTCRSFHWAPGKRDSTCNLFYHRYQQRVNRPLTAVFYLDSNSSCQEFPQPYFDYLTSNNFAKKPVSVNITTEIDFSVISVQQILNMTNKTSVLEVCRNRRCFLPNSRHAKCMQRLLLLPPRGREAKDFRWFRFPSNRAQ